MPVGCGISRASGAITTTCYCLSGLSLAQHYGRCGVVEVVGPLESGSTGRQVDPVAKRRAEQIRRVDVETNLVRTQLVNSLRLVALF